RVLERVDAIVARRRRIRRVVAGGVAIGFVAAAMAILGTEVLPGSKTPAPRREPVYVETASDFEFPPARAGGPADALGYLLPDAAPLSRFAAEYSDATDNAGSGEDVLGDGNVDLR
ncbi:MAG TPA: hypothetical protein VG274_07960, partial [Rhizomicrobium sp.]|nr:hypothetical protein [Rhizomicrobium sp.]